MQFAVKTVQNTPAIDQASPVVQYVQSCAEAAARQSVEVLGARGGVMFGEVPRLVGAQGYTLTYLYDEGHLFLPSIGEMDQQLQEDIALRTSACVTGSENRETLVTSQAPVVSG